MTDKEVQDVMLINISCKFEKGRYNIFFVRVVTGNGEISPHIGQKWPW